MVPNAKTDKSMIYFNFQAKVFRNFYSFIFLPWDPFIHLCKSFQKLFATIQYLLERQNFSFCSFYRGIMV
jgi:hypothetical protein